MCVYILHSNHPIKFIFLSLKLGAKKNSFQNFIQFYFMYHSVGKISEYLICGTKYFIFKVIGDMRSNPARAFVFVTFPRKKIKHIFLDKHCKI